MLEPEPGTRSSINHCDHASQRCSEKHMTGMARVGVLLPMGEWHTQQEGEADTTRWDRCGRRDVDGRNHADCYPKGTPSAASRGRSWPLNQVNVRTRPWTPEGYGIVGGSTA